MKLVAMLRIKNQILTIRECLNRLNDLVDEIVIVDNGSTDGTLEVYKEYKKIKAVKHTKGFDEGRDKIMVHELAKTRDPDWILWIDADEVFEDALTRKNLEKYMSNSKLNVVWFRLYHFWGQKKKFRIDGPWLKYTAFPQRMMWRNIKSAYFRDWKFHNGGIMGVPGNHITSHFRLKHFGYVYPEQLKNKKKTYTKLKKHPMSIKTLPFKSTCILQTTFIESQNQLLNRVIQKFIDIFFLVIEKNYQLLNLLKNRNIDL